ncbi:DUF3987 domain-containing protein [Macellibacteroides fermentans]|uniref:DUF3987 domain-containing protein n=1 Tax=Macellibacteroides fermentans TaxID=879969 RepID=UPI00352E6713
MNNEKESPRNSAEFSGADKILQDENTDIIKKIKTDIEKNSGKLKAIPFPIDVFPPLFREVILKTNEALNFPTDYSAATILTAVATIIGKTAVLEMKNGWKEFCPLYMNLLGNPGTLKSHPLDMFFDIIKTIDSEEYQNYSPKLAAFEEYQSMTRKEKQSVQKIEEPTLIKHIMSNFTPEILAKRIKDNNRSVCVVSEELESWLLGMNNYSKSDQSSTYLSFWSVKRTDVDRISNQKKPLIIERPFLCIIGSSQPRKLKKMFPVEKSDSGFLQRFLWAFPADSKKKCINQIDLGPFFLNNYNEWFRTYYEIYKPILFDSGQPKAKIYKFSPEALKIFLEWNKENTDKVNAAGDSLLSEEYNKFDIHFLRFALIMQIMEDLTGNTISVNATLNAVKLCAYFENTMLRVLNIIENQSELDMQKVALHLVKEGMSQLDAARYTGISQATISRKLNK